jgi:hypothetical protein
MAGPLVSRHDAARGLGARAHAIPARCAAAWPVGLVGGLALATACHDEQVATALQKKTQAAAAAAAAAAPTGPSQPPRPSVVLFSRRHGQLLPLACYSEVTQRLHAGSDCAGLLPEDAEVRIGDTYGGRLRPGQPLVCQTKTGPLVLPTFGLLEGPPGDAGPQPGPPLALWSSGPLPKLELPPSPPEPLPLPPSESLYITNSSRNLLPPAQRLLIGQVVVDNVWTVDLDADGLRERLDQVRLLEVRRRFMMLTGVFVVAGKDAVALRPLRVQLIPPEQRERLGRDDHSYDVKMLAALDLDHDSRRELWLQVARPETTTDSLGRFTDTGLAVFAELTCPNQPAAVSPPPPPPPPAAGRPPGAAPPKGPGPRP